MLRLALLFRRGIIICVQKPETITSLYWYSSTHHTLRMYLLVSNVLKTSLNRCRRLCKAENNRFEHSLGAPT